MKISRLSPKAGSAACLSGNGRRGKVNKHYSSLPLCFSFRSAIVLGHHQGVWAISLDIALLGSIILITSTHILLLLFISPPPPPLPPSFPPFPPHHPPCPCIYLYLSLSLSRSFDVSLCLSIPFSSSVFPSLYLSLHFCLCLLVSLTVPPWNECLGQKHSPFFPPTPASKCIRITEF